MTTEYEQSIKFNYVENDTLPEILCEYKYKDLSEFSSIQLHINYNDQPLIKNAVILDSSNGQFKFKFDTNELKAGYYDGEIQFTYTSGDVLTIKGLIFDIKEEIA